MPVKAIQAALCFCAIGIAISVCPAQTAPAADMDDAYIQLNFPQSVDLATLIEYVSKRLEINFIYSENIGASRVSMVSPVRIHKSELLDLLQRALNMNDLELVDTANPKWKTIGRKAVVQFVQVRHMNAADLAQQVTSVLAEKERITSAGGGVSAAPRRVVAAAGRQTVASGAGTTLMPDERTNQITVIGTESAVAEAVKLIEDMDRPSNRETRVYRLQYITPERLDGLIKSRIEAREPAGIYQATLDETSGLLIATAPPLVHDEIAQLQQELDISADPSRSYVQYYKLINTTAEDVLETIRSLQGQQAEEEEEKGVASTRQQFTGPNQGPTPGSAELPKPPMYEESPANTAQNGQPGQAGTSSSSGVSPAKLLSKDVVVTSDKNTNTIIVIGSPDVQAIYRELIAVLDKRRPQVLIEVTMVTLNTTDNFSLGVELGGSWEIGKEDELIAFSAFGLTDAETGLFTGGTGFNAAVLSPGNLDVFVRALKNDTSARVLAAPRILVNDNASGRLESLDEQPYTSVNASDTVATTSFAGYAEAGTTVEVTPHISEGEHLQLEYSVTLNSFTGTGSEGIPPPRATDSVNSEITVPNGYTVVVGGLRRRDYSTTNPRIPWLGDIPVFKYLFGSVTEDYTESALFVFIRPIILRDDQFEDLKYLSEHDLELAELPSNLPQSEPMLIR